MDDMERLIRSALSKVFGYHPNNVAPENLSVEMLCEYFELALENIPDGRFVEGPNGSELYECRVKIVEAGNSHSQPTE